MSDFYRYEPPCGCPPARAVDHGTRGLSPDEEYALALYRQRNPMGNSRLSVLGKAVHHIDGDRTNNHPDNLRVVDLPGHVSGDVDIAPEV